MWTGSGAGDGVTNSNANNCAVIFRWKSSHLNRGRCGQSAGHRNWWNYVVGLARGMCRKLLFLHASGANTTFWPLFCCMPPCGRMEITILWWILIANVFYGLAIAGGKYLSQTHTRIPGPGPRIPAYILQQSLRDRSELYSTHEKWLNTKHLDRIVESGNKKRYSIRTVPMVETFSSKLNLVRHCIHMSYNPYVNIMVR